MNSKTPKTSRLDAIFYLPYIVVTIYDGNKLASRVYEFFVGKVPPLYAQIVGWILVVYIAMQVIFLVRIGFGFRRRYVPWIDFSHTGLRGYLQIFTQPVIWMWSTLFMTMILGIVYNDRYLSEFAIAQVAFLAFQAMRFYIGKSANTMVQDEE